MSDPRKFKNDIVVEGDIRLPSEATDRALIIDGSGEIASSTVTTTELELLSGATVDLADLEQDVADLVTLSGRPANSTDLGTFTGTTIPDASDNKEALQALETALEAHIADASDAHDASAISNVPAGTIAATDVQAAINELDGDIQGHITDATDAHDASAISNVPSGNLAATDVQAALNELQSDIDTRALDADVIKKNGSVAFTGDQSMGGFRLTSLATPTTGSDAATKQYVDNALEGLRPKEAVRAASTADIDLTTGGELTIDGVALDAGDRVLVKDQTAPEDNGIYIVNVGSWTRSTDFDSLSPIDEINKAYVAVQEGTSNQGKLFVQYGVVTTLGVDPINFTFFNSVSGLTGGDGITVSGSNISVDHDGQGLTFVATQLALELDGGTLVKSASGLKLSDTDVTPGIYGGAATETVSFEVDQQGRLTFASEQAIAIPSTQVTDFTEAAQDAVGTILEDSDTINFSYNDGDPSIFAEVISQKSIESVAGGIQLVNDEATPAASYYYGTDGGAVRGYFPLPTGGSANDVQETTFSAANNQASPVLFYDLNAGVQAATVYVQARIVADVNAYEYFTLSVARNGGNNWVLSSESTGDDSGIVFSCTTDGEINYTSTNQSGFISNNMQFRIITLS